MENLLVARRPWLGLHPRPIPPGKQNNLLPRLSQRQPCTRSVGYEYQERTGRNGKEAAEIAAHSTRDRKEIHSLGDVMSARRKLAEKYASWSTLLPASIPTCSPPPLAMCLSPAPVMKLPYSPTMPRSSVSNSARRSQRPRLSRTSNRRRSGRDFEWVWDKGRLVSC
jgi:hypothetical protein